MTCIFRRPWLLIALSLALLPLQEIPLGIAEAHATTYQIQARTAARATQHVRADRSFATPRIFSQSLTLSAYDLRDNQANDFSARVSLRYGTDLGLATRLRQDPLFDPRWNDLSLDLAYLQWRPSQGVELTAGRHWHPSPLGVTDLDGLSVAWRADRRANDGDLVPFLRAAAGRDVQRGLTPFDPGTWDVQGLPPNQAGLTDDPWHLILAAQGGLTAADHRHRVEIAARQTRRPRRPGEHRWSTTHRVGATGTISPAQAVTLSSTASFHSLVGTVDRARLDAAWQMGRTTWSAGVDQRRPVFDAASIFNLFGAQPHRSAYASVRRPIDAVATTLEVRTWGRAYFNESAPLRSLGDEQAIGGAVAAHQSLFVLVPLDVMWQFSAQTLTDRSGGDQYLGTLRVRAPGPRDGVYLTGRMMGLWATPDHHRRQAGYATSAGLGAEVQLSESGTLGVSMESRMGSITRTNTALFALFELDTRR